MICVWVRKFMLDEDLCLVDYKSFGNTNDIELPEVSFCFKNPFIEEQLQEFGTNSTAYLQHLSGTGFSESLNNINYADVTLDIKDHFNRSESLYEDGTVNANENIVIQSTVNDFYYGYWFRKCFTIDTKELNKDGIKVLTHIFNSDLFQHYMEPAGVKQNQLVFLHSPYQILLGESFKIFSFERYGSIVIPMGVMITITRVEILRRRNKPKEPCLTNWMNWDEYEYLRHTEQIGCSASYHKSRKMFPKCSNATEMDKWRQIMNSIKAKRDDLPCQVMPRIDFDFTTTTTDVENKFIMTVVYPKQVKIITQSRAVDENVVIGNIGGYIGLFLGILCHYIA